MAGTKNRLLFLLQYLLEHTDDVHTISADALMKVYENNGYKGSRNTIRDDIAALNEAGFEIAGDMRQGKRVYYIIDRRFELSELKMLVDAVSSCRFITKAKSEALIEKLTMMTNEENRPSLTAKVFTTDRIKTSNPTVSRQHQVATETSICLCHTWKLHNIYLFRYNLRFFFFFVAPARVVAQT